MIRRPASLAALTATAATAFMAIPALGATDRGAEKRRLDRNRALWAQQHLRDYSYRLTISCFCPPDVRGPVTITVRNGRPRGTDKFHRAYDTVPELFKAIAGTLSDPKAGDVRATYSRHRGFPRTASLDRIKLAIDDEIEFTVDRFKILK